MEYRKYRIFIESGIKKLYGEGAHIVAEYDYFDPHGDYVYSKVRFEGGAIKGKEMRYYSINRTKDYATSGKGGYSGLALYNYAAVKEAIKNGMTVFYVEGEKDVDTLSKFGFSATTAGSVSDWKKELRVLFRGADLCIIPDNDTPGKKLSETIAKDVNGFAFCVRKVVLKLTKTNEEGVEEKEELPEHGDVSDFFALRGTNKEFCNLVSESTKIYAPWCNIEKKANGKETVSINLDRLALHIRNNEHYLLVRSANDDKDLLYCFQNGYYQQVNENSFCCRVIMPYIPVGKATSRTAGQILSLIQMTDERNIVSFEALNTDERYINVKNGLVDVFTGQLEPFDPQVKTTWQIPVAYGANPSIPHHFLGYLNDLVTNTEGQVDESIKSVLQEVIGLLLSNIPFYRIKKCICLMSEQGNTGKSQLIKLLQHLLGLNNIASIDLLDMDPTRNKGRFALGQLMGKRAILVGDQSMGVLEDSSVLKRLTGGDATEMEAKHKAQQYQIWNGGIFVCGNKMPIIKDDQGKHIFERLLLIQLYHTIPVANRDPQILNKMIAEADGIFVWAFQGLQRLVKNNYKLSTSVAIEEALDSYRTNTDPLFKFITERYEITCATNDRVPVAEFEENFRVWFRYSKYTRDMPELKPSEIRSKMASYGVTTKRVRISSTMSGIASYIGIKSKMVVADQSEKIIPLIDSGYLKTVS